MPMYHYFFFSTWALCLLSLLLKTFFTKASSFDFTPLTAFSNKSSSLSIQFNSKYQCVFIQLLLLVLKFLLMRVPKINRRKGNFEEVIGIDTRINRTGIKKAELLPKVLGNNSAIKSLNFHFFAYFYQGLR